MKFKHTLSVVLAASLAFASVGAFPARAVAGQTTAAQVSPLRLYTLDCGVGTVTDMGLFADTGEYDGQSGVLPSPCFLIQHGDVWMLWDTGLGDEIAAMPNGLVFPGGVWTVRSTLVSQLSALGLTPRDIDFVALSHAHMDHVGNAGLFAHATWLIDPVERATLQSDPAPIGVDPAKLSVLDTAAVREVHGDADVFGDGSVRILATPGHTAGHKALLVRLPNSGPVLLTGDLYHTRENRVRRRVPSVNTDRADTLASFDRFEGVAAHEEARVVIQHVQGDVDSLPAFPAWLD